MVNRSILFFVNDICPNCKKTFSFSGPKKYCSPHCRKDFIFNKRLTIKECCLCKSKENLCLHHLTDKDNHLKRFSKKTIPICLNCHNLIHKYLAILYHKNFRILPLSRIKL